MGLVLNNNEIDSIYLGNNMLSALYLGDYLIYPTREPDLDLFAIPYQFNMGPNVLSRNIKVVCKCGDWDIINVNGPLTFSETHGGSTECVRTDTIVTVSVDPTQITEDSTFTFTLHGVIDYVVTINYIHEIPQPTNEIWYETDGNDVSEFRWFNALDADGNTMTMEKSKEGDKFIIRTPKPIVSVSGHFFYHWYTGGKLTYLSLPSTLTSISGGLCLYAQNKLKSIDGHSPLVVKKHYVYEDTTLSTLGKVVTDQQMIALDDNTNLTKIDGYSLGYIDSATTIIFPTSLQTFDSYVFEGSNHLETLGFKSLSKPTITNQTFSGIPNSGVIYIECNADSTWDSFSKPSGWTLTRQC